MTEYELLELQNTYLEAFAAYVMNFISIVSGFLLANHFLGRKITSAQFYVMTLAYTYVILITIVGCYNATINFNLVEQTLGEMDRTFPTTYGEDIFSIPQTIAMIMTFFGSLYFAHTSRKRHETAG